MNILFIYPNSGAQVGFNYGIAHIAGVLNAAGYRAMFWQLCEDLESLPSQEEFITRIKHLAPDVIAFSVVTNQWPYTRQLAQWLRSELRVPIVCGGVHALFSAEEILATGLFDYVFRGECEEAFAEFVDKLSRKEPVDQVRNLALIHAGRVQVNPVRPLPHLETLPPKDYTIMDFQRLIDAKKGWVGLMASRGCPFSCTYCFNHQMVARYRQDLQCSFAELNYIRRFPVAAMIDEIRYLLTNYQRITMFIFDDDLFTFDKEYVRQFCRAYRQVTDLPFVVNAHVNFFDAEIAGILADAGCRIVKYGMESGSPDIRKRILNRHMTNDNIIKAIGQVNHAGMHSSVFIIIGFPYETVENVMETLRLLGASRPGRFRWTYFFPFPGTKSHELSVQGGYIDQQKMAELVNFTDQSCLNFGPEQNLFLEKVGRVMPWFVNAYSDLPVAEFYRQKVEELLGLDRPQWEQTAPTLHAQDKAFSRRFAACGLSHYAIKYNPFMGVISDYFLHEK